MDAVESVTGKLFDEDWSRLRCSRQGLDVGKSFGIMRTAKIKTLGNMGASLQHTFRERETPNADPDRLKANTILVGADNSQDVLAAWHKRAPEKIRSNAVHGLEYFIGGSPERMQAMTGEEQDSYFKDALHWIEERHGADNVLSAMIHRDETTPHMTVMTIPLDARGKLNCRSFVGNKKALSDLQSDFADKVSEKYGLRRGIKGSTARHERVQRIYSAYTTKEDTVEIPERARGSLLRGGQESDAEWHAKAIEAATDRVRALLLEMRDRDRASETKINIANEMIDNLRSLARSYKEQLDETRATLSRFVSSMELAGLGKEANVALERYSALEARVIAGDLTVIKDAAGSLHQIDKIAEAFDRIFPEGTEIDENQARFDRALNSVIDAMANGKGSREKTLEKITLNTRPLPHVQKALAHLSEGPTTSTFNSKEEQFAFGIEIEGSLSAPGLARLHQGDASVLSDILGDQISEPEQMRLALAYYDCTEVEISPETRLALIERLTEVEYNATHKDTESDRGPIH